METQQHNDSLDRQPGWAPTTALPADEPLERLRLDLEIADAEVLEALWEVTEDGEVIVDLNPDDEVGPSAGTGES